MEEKKGLILKINSTNELHLSTEFPKADLQAHELSVNSQSYKQPPWKYLREQV